MLRGVPHPYKCLCVKFLLASSSLPNGEKESNSPIRVYDTSGAWGDASFHKDPTKGLPSVRSRWILERNDTSNY